MTTIQGVAEQQLLLKEGKVSAATMIESIANQQSVWPYSVEILVFPFEHPSIDYSQLVCDDFEMEHQKTGRSIYMMEMTNLNDGTDTNALFKFMKEVMNTKDFNLSTTQFFVFTPDWDELEYHYGKSLLDMKDVIRELLKSLEPADEL